MPEKKNVAIVGCVFLGAPAEKLAKQLAALGLAVKEIISSRHFDDAHKLLRHADAVIIARWFEDDRGRHETYCLLNMAAGSFKFYERNPSTPFPIRDVVADVCRALGVLLVGHKVTRLAAVRPTRRRRA